MKIAPFKLERFFAKYEFSTKYLLSASDCDGLKQSELLSLADSQTKKLWDDLALGYTQSQGLPVLREEIAKLYQGVRPEEILLAAPEESIFITLNSLLKKGDHIIVTFPGYQSLYEIAKSIDCEISLWQGDEQNNWYFNPNFLEQNIKSNTKLIIINFPHNPTGFLPSKSDFQRIIAIARQKNVYLFSDEMYWFLEYDKSDRLPSAAELYEKGISLFGMSKTFGLAGLRIGWLVIRDKKLLETFSSFKDYTTICSSAPSEILALIALKAKDKIIQKNLKVIKRNLKLLDNFFSKYSKLFSWVKPKAGTICFPKLKVKQSSSKFCQQLIKEEGIMLLPSEVYDYGDNHFRLGFGRKNMPEVLGKLEEYIKLKQFI